MEAGYNEREEGKQPGELSRRDFLGRASALGVCLAAGASTGLKSQEIPDEPSLVREPYDGPNIVLIRFGGGVRRRETIDPVHTCAPWMMNELVPRGTLFSGMYFDEGGSHEVGHGQGTLNLLTGRYAKYEDVSGQFLGEGFESKSPTLFEYLRGEFNVPDHEAIIINGEDRTQEEFYSFSNSHLFGARFRSSVLSLYRYKIHLLRRKMSELDPGHPDFLACSKTLIELEKKNYRSGANHTQSPAIENFWDEWQNFYGRSGLKNPRGDRLLTELSSWALKKLRPRLIMINYNDPDYVHWGYMAHYTRAISIIDQGIRRIYEQCQSDEFYRDRTLFAVVPDCGRDTNPLVAVPCQHHFNTRSSREIFGLIAGPGVEKNQIVTRESEQIAIPTTLATLAGIPMPSAEKTYLDEAIS